MNSEALSASRTEAVAMVTRWFAPRASAMERKRPMQAAARSMASGARRPSRSVSWPRRTTSFSRAMTAKESEDAASTTASLMEFEPMSMAASFNAYRSLPASRRSHFFWAWRPDASPPPGSS